jgi:acyl dehydratase
MKYWEDFSHTFSEQEIVAFGRQYDPQPFHIDPEKARGSPFGGLIASGWQTCAIGMRLKPVHRWEAVNQRGELVLTMEGWGMFGRKD